MYLPIITDKIYGVQGCLYIDGPGIGISIQMKTKTERLKTYMFTKILIVVNPGHCIMDDFYFLFLLVRILQVFQNEPALFL